MPQAGAPDVAKEPLGPMNKPCPRLFMLAIREDCMRGSRGHFPALSYNNYASAMLLRHGTVTLRALVESDLPEIAQLLSLSDVNRYTTPFWRPWGDPDCEAFIRSGLGPNDFRFGITLTGEHDGQLIGVVEVNRTNWVHGTGEVGIMIWPNDLRRHGHGTNALLAVSNWAFNTVRLRRLHAKVIATNTASIRVFEKAGFIHEGTWRKHFFLFGREIDALLYGLLARDFLVNE
jgi:ribosomal-protein-serine acetyltransferase